MLCEEEKIMSQLTFKSMALGVVFAISAVTPAMAEDTFTVPHGSWATESVGSGSMIIAGQTIPMPPINTSTTACITPEEAVLSKDQIFGDALGDAGTDCTGTQFSAEGNTVTMSMTCDFNGIKMTTSGTTTFSEGRKSSTTDMTMQGVGENGEAWDMTMTSTSTHMGSCEG